MVKPSITHKRLKEILNYDLDTGIFTYAAARGRNKVGQVAGAKTGGEGYVRIQLEGKDYKAHRLAWFYVHGTWAEHYIDHIDNVRDNNRISNLREATPEENGQNKKKTLNIPNRTAKYLGVSYKPKHNKHKPWGAQLTVKGKKIHLGYHPTAEAAHEAYLVSKRKHHSHNTL